MGASSLNQNNSKSSISNPSINGQNSANIFGGLEMSGYAKPDITQMLPFKPKLPSAVGYTHPVSGGI